jgi:hypothetical protein
MAIPTGPMDLVYRVLDDQLVDVDGHRCGRADDIQFDGGLGERPVVHAILSCSGTWHRRLPRPLRSLGARVFGTGVLGGDVLQVPWDEVDDLGSVIRLKARARDLGLGQGDRRQARIVARLPDS